MRAANRKVNRQPVRSPSPDIAAKNKITTTSAPVSEVMKKSRINSLGMMPHEFNVEQMQKIIVDWEEKYKLLEKQLNSLLLENSSLKKQINHLQNILAQTKPVFTAPSPDNQTLKQYEGRIRGLTQEIRRIQDLCGKEKARNQLLEEENQRYRIAADRKDNQLNRQINQMKQTWDLSFERIKQEQEHKVRLTFATLGDRLARIEKTQFSLETSLARSEFRTPKVKKQPREEDSTHPGNQSSSAERKFLRRSIPKQQEPSTSELKIQNTRLKQSLDKEKSKQQTLYQTCEIYQRKIAELELQIESLTSRKQKEVQQSLNESLQLQKQRFAYSLQNYLQQIRQTKHILKNQKFRQFIQQITKIVKENKELTSLLDQLEEEKDVMIKQHKIKAMQNSLKLSNLQRQNQQLKSKLELQNQQLNQLRSLLEENISQKKQRKYENRDVNSRMIQKCIEEAIERLERIENSMENTLREESHPHS